MISLCIYSVFIWTNEVFILSLFIRLLFHFNAFDIVPVFLLQKSSEIIN